MIYSGLPSSDPGSGGGDGLGAKDTIVLTLQMGAFAPSVPINYTPLVTIFLDYM